MLKLNFVNLLGIVFWISRFLSVDLLVSSHLQRWGVIGDKWNTYLEFLSSLEYERGLEL